MPAISNPALQIKATDFKQPNVYQEFTVTFEHADMGFVGVGCSYLGNVEASWDRAAAELVEPWSPQRLEEHYKALAPPKGLELQRDEKLDVLVIRGLWNRLHRIDEALSPLNDKTVVSSAYTTFHQQQDTQLSGFKLDWQPLFTQDVVVLANVETRGLGLGQVRMIGEFVQQGGGLVSSRREHHPRAKRSTAIPAGRATTTGSLPAPARPSSRISDTARPISLARRKAKLAERSGGRRRWPRMVRPDELRETRQLADDLLQRSCV